MIFGRPTNLWLGLVTAGVALAQGVAITVFELDAVKVGTIAALMTAFLGAGIALLAAQPPTLKDGDPYVVVTPAGNENVTKTANTNLAAVAPVSHD